MINVKINLQAKYIAQSLLRHVGRSQKEGTEDERPLEGLIGLGPHSQGLRNQVRAVGMKNVASTDAARKRLSWNSHAEFCALLKELARPVGSLVRIRARARRRERECPRRLAQKRRRRRWRARNVTRIDTTHLSAARERRCRVT